MKEPTKIFFKQRRKAPAEPAEEVKQAPEKAAPQPVAKKKPAKKPKEPQPVAKKPKEPKEPKPVIELTPEEQAAEAERQAAAKAERDRQKLEQSAINIARFLKSQSMLLIEKLNQLPFDAETDLAEEIHEMTERLTEYLIIAVDNNNPAN